MGRVPDTPDKQQRESAKEKVSIKGLCVQAGQDGLEWGQQGIGQLSNLLQQPRDQRVQPGVSGRHTSEGEEAHR